MSALWASSLNSAKACGRRSRHGASPLPSFRYSPKLPRTLTVHGRPLTRLRAEPELEEQPLEFKSEEELKKEKADELRKAETFMIIGEGNATCSVCQYNYEFAKGDPDFPIAPGTRFQDLPDDYRCPLCGAPKEKFRSTAKTVAGFAVNQGYGFGTNSWTGDQKQLIIFGTLLFFFALFLSGYFLD